ncbi:MAG: DUF3576 domain-containing protein [Pelagibacteraceae bacterium TMED246]|nr:MAG: DUF3576 domain-containing protein [Pelagibacteraceae bacterium TMED246]|tara:strand:+ start:8543 stop:9127 length:585 start_codon:yes stop_codon:yes gene_type:complete
MNKSKLILLFVILALVQNCGIYKRSDVKDNPVGVKDRVKKNIEEGRGFRIQDKLNNKGGGVFDFASSNELWRASIEVLNFVTFTNATYSGGILITDWFNSDTGDGNKDIKITIRFLSNEIRADGLEVDLHQRVCDDQNKNSCKITKITSNIQNEIKLAILKRATIFEKEGFKKNRKKFKESGKRATVGGGARGE